MNFPFKRTSLALAMSLFSLGSAPTASAQEWGFSVGKRYDRGHVSISIGSRHGRWDRRHDRRHDHHDVRRVQRHVHGSQCWTEGGYRDVEPYQAWVPGRVQQVWIGPHYDEYVDHRGITRRRWNPGHYDTVRDPGYYETRYRRVWVPRRLVCTHRGY